MKFSAPVVALLAAGANAQIATVKGVLSDVQSGIQSLDSTVKSFSGDDKPLISSSEKLVSTINDGKSTVDGSKMLSLADALGLQAPVKTLTSNSQTLVNDLKAKKSAIEKGGFCEETRTQVTDIDTASNALIDSVVSKVPKDAQSIADSLAADLRKVLNDAKTSFDSSNCVDAAGSGGNGGGSGGDTTKPTTGPTSESSMPTQTGGAGMTTASSAPATESSASMAPTTMASVTAVGPGGSAPNSTETSVPPVVTAGAASLFPAGALALGLAVLAL